MNYVSPNERIRKKLFLLQTAGYGNYTRQNIPKIQKADKWALKTNFPTLFTALRSGGFKPAGEHFHDWGGFGKYEYLGPGTPATWKTRQGIKPRNEIDRLAQEHDLYYAKTQDWPAYRSPVRGMVDVAAGSGMFLQSLNPWSDLDADDRVLGVIAGTGLMIQGALRVHPLTSGPMILIDWILY
jgi:hypothetical protein